MMIDDVIAMHAPGPRAQVRRCIAMSNAQRCEVWDQVGGLREGEVTIELQTIGGDGNGRCFPHFKNHAVVNGCMSRLPSFEPECQPSYTAGHHQAPWEHGLCHH